VAINTEKFSKDNTSIQTQTAHLAQQFKYQLLQSTQVTVDSIKKVVPIPWTCLKSGPF
jgi:hypothetical protein